MLRCGWWDGVVVMSAGPTGRWINLTRAVRLITWARFDHPLTICSSGWAAWVAFGRPTGRQTFVVNPTGLSTSIGPASTSAAEQHVIRCGNSDFDCGTHRLLSAAHNEHRTKVTSLSVTAWLPTGRSTKKEPVIFSSLLSKIVQSLRFLSVILERFLPKILKIETSPLLKTLENIREHGVGTARGRKKKILWSWS